MQVTSNRCQNSNLHYISLAYPWYNKCFLPMGTIIKLWEEMNMTRPQLSLRYSNVVGLLVVVLSLLTSEAQAATYYLSPNGSDSASGTSSAAPWKTFGFAIPKLKPGDSLILRDGTYNASNSGYPYISCGSTAVNGTSSAHITLQAQNERQALIAGTGQPNTINLLNCSYWDFIGLRIEGADLNSGTTGQDGHVVFGTNVTNTTWRRNLIRFNNRWRNSHLINFEFGIVNNLFEENEFYSWHRHAVAITAGNGNILRRNYFNSREYADLPGCVPLGSPWCSADPARGEAGIALYPASNSILENNIYEDVDHPVEINGGADNNKLYGEIVINNTNGVILSTRGNDISSMTTNTYLKDYVFIGGAVTRNIFPGYWPQSAKNARCDNCSFIGSAGHGIIAQQDTSAVGDGVYSVFSDNSLFLNNSSPWNISGQSNWLIDYARVYGNAQNPSPGLTDSHVTNKTTTDPSMGSCKVWIPTASNLKGSGKGGADIGANVLYEYVNGTLTSTPLWNSSTNKFVGEGAVIAGVNDIAGRSLDNITSRLNIGTANGCAFPAGYGTGATTAPPPSNSLANSGTMTGNSQNFAPDHSVDHLWDGCLDGTPTCTSGNQNISSFWIEFDLGQLYNLTQARLYGDADSDWLSSSWQLQYKQNITDAWNTAFSNVNALFDGWSTQNLSLTARYVRVEVFGNQSGLGTQARELEINGTAAGNTPPQSPSNLSLFFQ
jgi:F5/8 type C domain